MFGYVYPGERAQVPAWVMHDLLDRLRDEMDAAATSARVCRGTLVSREQYLHDLQREGYVDARLPPFGSMRAEDVATWTEAIAGRTTDDE
jgi:hypothetical protein